MASTTEKLPGPAPGAGAGAGDDLILPTTNSPHHHGPGSGEAQEKDGLRLRDWVHSPRSGEARHPGHGDNNNKNNNTSGQPTGSGSESGPGVPGHHRAPKYDPWWRIHLFRGMVNDIRKRAPFYLSDWTDAWNYRVVPATVYMFFAKSVPPRRLFTTPLV